MPAAPNGKSPNRIMTVFLKELVETLRDRRTVFGVIISPLILTPGLFALLGRVIHDQTEKARTETLVVGVVQRDQAPELVKLLEKTPNIEVRDAAIDKAEARIRSRELRAVVVMPRGATQSLAVGDPVNVRILFDAGNDKSAMAAARVRAAMLATGSVVLKFRLSMRGLPAGFATPITTEDAPIKSGGSAGALVIAGMLPYMLALSCFSSGIHAANDSVAGEKERGTLETLLVSPATRRELVVGKFCAVAALSMIGAILSVVGMAIPFFSGLPVFAWLAKGGMHMSVSGLGVVLIMLIPLAFLFAGLLLTVSTIARNQKEAQAYLGPMMILILIPAMMSMFQGSEAPTSVALVPVLNAALIIKQSMLNSTDPKFIALAVVASVAYAGAAVLLAARMFGKESVLLRT